MKYPIEVFKQTKQQTLYILAFITSKCNYKCWYCYNNKKQYYTIDLDILFKFLTQLRSSYQYHIDLNLIGGEPTCHKNIVEFISKCYYLYDLNIYIITNLSKPTEYYIKFNNFQCKITASYHSQYNFNTFFNTVKNISTSCNIIKDIIVMCNPYLFDNSLYAYNEIRNLANTVKNKFKVELDLVDNFKYSSKQYIQINKILSNKAEYTVNYSDGSTDNVCFTDIANNKTFKFKTWLCNAGKDIIYIHGNGNIYPCESWYNENFKPISNIYINNFQLNKKPVICKCNTCSGDFNIYKKYIFNNYNF